MRQLTVCFVLLLAAFYVSCGDGASGGAGSDGAQIGDEQCAEEARAAGEQSSDEAFQAFCDCYADNSYGGDIDACVGDLSPDWSMSSCQRIAASCNVQDYEAFQRCQVDNFAAYEECVATCPATTEQCNEAFSNGQSECNGLWTQQLDSAFSQCEQGQTPSCAGSSPPTGGGDAERLFVDNQYWLSSFDTSWRPPSLAWNQRELDPDGSTTVYATVRIDSGGTYTYAQRWSCFSCTSGDVVTHESGTWSINGSELTINDGCGRTYTHDIAVQGDRIFIGALEWQHSQNTRELYEMTLDSASESCVGYLPSDNPQKQN